MKSYIEAVLHQDIHITPFEANNQLPLILRRGYRIFDMFISGHKVLLAEPVDATPLADLKKHQKQITAYTGYRCVLLMNIKTWYLIQSYLWVQSSKSLATRGFGDFAFSWHRAS